ncbi:hypothetical protein WMF30_05610 [Sorangium sp. So ce134]
MTHLLAAVGRCTNYSFPAPCGSRVGGGDSFSWAVSEDGTSLVELLAGTQVGEDTVSFCGVQVMQQNTFPARPGSG